MKIWQFVLAGLATLAVTSALKVGPVRLVNNHRFINFTEGASPQNSLLECGHQLEGEETVTQISWKLWDSEIIVGSFDWEADGNTGAFGKLAGKVKLTREDGSLELTQLQYDLSGEYSCSVTVNTGDTEEAAKWEAIIIDSVSHLSTLHRSISDCTYTSSFSTLAMFPKPEVRAGLYSETLGGFYKEIPESQWLITDHENRSFTYAYQQVSFEFDAETPIDVSFRVTVGVMKADGNYIPVSYAEDKHIILHQLGCPEPRGTAYQHIDFHRDTITCRGEHKEAEATVTCKEGTHADGDVEAVLITCDEPTQTWVLEDGRPARREHLKCVVNGARSTASISAALLAVALAFQRFLFQ